MEKLEKKNGMEKLMLETLMEQQREYFASGATLPVKVRMEALSRLEMALQKTGADPLQSAAYGSWKEQDGECDV